MAYLFLDFETSSQADLAKIDTYNYIMHKTTKVLCCSYIFLDDPTTFDPDKIRLIWGDMPEIPQDTILVAHNAAFEQGVIRRFFPDNMFKIASWIDTMALASINNIRRGLAQACVDCGIGGQKHEAGKWVMRKLNNSALSIDDLSLDEMANLAAYCKQDVDLTVQLFNRLISTYSMSERKLWNFTNEQNWKGVHIDLELAKKAHERVKAWALDVPKVITELTDGKVTAINQVAKLTSFLGVENVKAETLIEKLKTETDLKKIQAMKLRLEGGKKSVSKFEAILDKQVNGKLLHTMDYHGTSTGRFSSRGVQLLNLIKADKEIAETLIYELKNDIPWPATSTISKASKIIRGLFIPPEGSDLIKADYSQIEARILAWLVNDEELVESFRNGDKIYEKMAAKIFNVPLENVTQDQRFYGKSAVLGCGYGMGANKFALTYKVSEELAERSVFTYRDQNKKIVKFWGTLEKAIEQTIQTGKKYDLGPLTIWRDSWRLFIKLPSGRNLVYPRPHIKDGKIHHFTRKNGVFVERSAWGGVFTENICQAIGRDLLVAAILELRFYEEYQFMFTVYDEFVYSAPVFCYDAEEFSQIILKSAPDWALGLPLAVETEIYHRYFK